MGSKPGDARARAGGKEMAQRVLAQIERERPAVPNLEKLPSDRLMTVTSRIEVPAALAGYVPRGPLGSSPVYTRTQDEGFVIEATRRTAGTLIAEGDSWFDYPFN